MKHLLAAFLVLVRADDRLSEALHEIGFVDEFRRRQAALLSPAHEIFDSDSRVGM